MDHTNKPKKEMPEFTIYGHGIACASVCTRLDIEEATVRLNKEYPTGIESNWEWSTDTYFYNSKHENGCQCHDDPRNKHYLFNC